MSEADGALGVAVDLPAPVSTNTVITVSATLLMPASQQVTIPAGATRGFVIFLLADDSVIQGTRQTVLRASATGYTSALTVTLIIDDDVATVGLNLPDTITEGSSGTGTITFSRAASYSVPVSLSALGSGLSMPSSVTVPAGFTSYSFTFSALNDSVIGPDFDVVVNASVATWGATAKDTVRVINNDLRVLSLVVGATVAENATGATGRVTIPGTLTVPLTVALSSDSPILLGVPASVVIPAGATQVDFALSPVNDPAATGVRQTTVRAEAASFTSASAVVSVTDVTVAELIVGAAPSWGQIGANVVVAVSARNLDRQVVAGFTGAYSASWENAATGAAVGEPLTGVFVAGQASVTLPVPNTLEPVRVRLKVGALESLTGEIRPYRQLTVAAAGLAVDPVRDNLLFTSGTTAAAGFVNTLVTVDPRTGSLTASPFIGSDPRTLAITDDGAYAYVGLWTAGQVVQYNLATKSVVRSFSLTGSGYPWNTSSYSPSDIETVPGLPDSVLVSQDDNASTYNALMNYRNGVLIGTPASYHSIARSSRAGVVYGLDNTNTGFDFGQVTVTASGATFQAATAKPFQSFIATIQADGDLVVGSDGVVVDGATLLSRGKLVLPTSVSSWAVEADASVNRIYAADINQGLYVFDSISLRQVSRITLPASTSTISEIKRWGTNGVALRLASGAVMILTHPDIAPTAPAANLGVVFETTDGVLNENTLREFGVVVTNHGPNPAQAVRVAFGAPTQISVQNIVANGATVESTASTFLARIGDLPTGQSRTVRFKLSTGVVGPAIVEASVLSDSIDPVSSNDLASQPVSVVFDDVPNAVHALELYGVDIVAHPTLPLVYVSTGKTGAPTLANRVLEIDPRTGRVLRSIFTGQNPRALAITDGGEYLYVALNDVAQVLRIRLSDFSIGLTIDLPTSVYGTYPAQDIVTLAGQPESIAVSLSYYGVYIVDGSIPRTNHTSVYDGGRVERGDAPDILYTYDDYTSGFEFTRTKVDANGITQLPGAKTLFSGYYVDFVSSGGLALASTGQLVDGVTMTLRGVLSGMNSTNGTPALEAARQRAYAVVGNELRAYDITQLAVVRKVALPATTAYVAKKTIRWGADGFAILQAPQYSYSDTVTAGRIVFVRSDMVPAAGPYELDLFVDLPVASTATVREAALTISGRAFAAAGIDSVKINGVSAGPLDVNGKWSKAITLVPGLNTLTVVARTAGASPVEKTLTLTYTFQPLLPTAWTEAMLPGVAVTAQSLVDDYDRDGWSTLQEFALRGDPVNPDAGFAGEGDPGDPLLFTFWRPVGAWATAVQMKLQLSEDLQTWRSPADAEVEWLTPGPLDAAGNYQRARFRLHPTGASAFWRLRISTDPADAAVGQRVP